jgi:hypothetical protein
MQDFLLKMWVSRQQSRDGLHCFLSLACEARALASIQTT